MQTKLWSIFFTIVTHEYKNPNAERPNLAQAAKVHAPGTKHIGPPNLLIWISLMLYLQSSSGSNNAPKVTP